MTGPDWPMPRGARIRLRVAWLAATARRWPRRALAIAATTVAVTGLVVAAASNPAGACRLHVVTAPGTRAHWACAQVTP